MAERIQRFCEQKNIFYEGQADFRKHRSTIDALIDIFTFLQQIKRQAGDCGILSFYISSAFDTIPQCQVLDVMCEEKLLSYLVMWV